MANFDQHGGTGGGSYASYFTGRLIVEEQSYSIENNTSLVYYELQLISGSSGTFYGYGASYNIIINGTTVSSGSGTYEIRTHNTTLSIISGTTTVEHNADGSKTIACSASLDFSSGTYSPGDFNPSGNLTLTTIPRASTISFPATNIGSANNIIINRASNSFTHTLTYAFGSLYGTIVTKTSDTSVSWTIPDNFYTQIPNAKSGIGTITCITYNGDTEIGTTTTTLIANTVENDAKPILNANVIDINQDTIDLTGDNTILVLNASTARISITSTLRKSAGSITSITINNNNVGTNASTIVDYQNISTGIFTIVVTDSRGYTAQTTLSPIVKNYIVPTLTANFIRLSPTSGQINLNYNGTWFGQSFGSVTNTLTVEYKYKLSTDNVYTTGLVDITPTTTDTTYMKISTNLGTSFIYTNAYDFVLTISDKLNTVTYSQRVLQGIPIFQWNEDTFQVNGDLNISGTLRVNNIDIVSKIKEILKTTISGTPDNNGFISSGLGLSNSIISCAGSDGFYTPFIDSGNDRITIKCETWDRQPITTRISLEIYYIERF